MKQILCDIKQKRPYADFEGVCLIKLEDYETIEDVKKEYVDVERQWYETTYSDPQEISEYTEVMWDKSIKNHTGRLVLMHASREYTD